MPIAKLTAEEHSQFTNAHKDAIGAATSMAGRHQAELDALLIQLEILNARVSGAASPTFKASKSVIVRRSVSV